MSLELKNVKGTKDFLSFEQQIRNNIRNTCEEIFQLYGCKPLETPILNTYELMTYKYGGGEEIVKEIYQLEDQAKRKLALRYDLTMPFAKVIGMNPDVRLPYKRYEIGKVFRNGPIKTGRLREFVQCDVDIVGTGSIAAEAELMMMAIDIFNKLELEITIQYNNRKLLAGVLEEFKVKKEQINDVFLSLDKVEKVGIEGVEKELLKKQVEGKTIAKIISLLTDDRDKDFSFFEEAFTGDLVHQGISELRELKNYLEKMDISENTNFNPFLARGLSIYTGTVYEIFLKDGSITSSIGSGGRYDNIINQFLSNEKRYPTVGISFGLDVIFTALSTQLRENHYFSDILIVPLGTLSVSLKLAHKLRINENLKVEIEYSQKKLKNALNYANKEKIPYVLIIGEEELKHRVVTVKWMNEGIQQQIPLKVIEKGELRKVLEEEPLKQKLF